MTTKPARRWQTATFAGAAGTALLLAGCGADGGAEQRSVSPTPAIAGPAIGLAEEVPAELAFVDQSVAPSIGTIAAATGVHSAPDRLYTRLGEARAGDTVGLTGNRADVGDEQWAEIIWETGTAWIATTALAG